ncbi:hypothetical protein CWE22_02315 [Pseudidiomarina aestuarii]|uniref:Uncharacterized protein n=1 Tax=Pseudidiomarina aestuarii TaxID=624146 RepID=A0A7Z7ETG3_9GAMM|nr:hypothetical protein [Pseudidiomarina aestuarii]RUO41046.1 hypothetical protein CWE22_02315 [Pseudidiomarina aestuarii]
MTKTLHHIRHWPTPEWRERYLLAPSCVLLSEAALLHAYQVPGALREIPVPAYVLIDELAQLQAHYPILSEEPPAGLIQVNAAQWVELTLNCQPVLLWDDMTVAANKAEEN